MPIIQVPDIALKLYRRFRLESVPDSLLAPETVPVVIVEDLSDFMVEGGGRPCMGATDVAPVAAQVGYAVLGNVAEQTRVRVSHVNIDVQTAMQVLVIAHTQTAITITPGSKAFLDRRVRGNPQSLIGFGASVVPPVGITIWNNWVLARAPTRIPIGMLLGSGEFAGNSRIVVRAVTVNVAMRIGFEWIEGVPEG